MTTATPTSPAELEEWLHDSNAIAASVTDGTFADIVQRYVASAAPQVGPDIKAEIQRTMAEYIKESRERGSAPVDLSADLSGRRGSGARNASYNREAPAASLDGTYRSVGSLALDVQRDRSGRTPANPEAFEKVRKLSNAYTESEPSVGGFLVPEEVRSNLLQTTLEKSIVRSLATVITMGSLTTKIPFVDATTNVGSVFGGMVFYWIGESQSITPTEARFGNVKLEANKLVGGARIPNELWNDAPALVSFVDTAAPQGMSFFEDTAFISGNGVDQPLGVRNSTAKIQVTRATNDLLAPADIYGMYSRMLPQSLGNAVWLVNQTLLPLLFGMQTVVKNVAGTENVGGGFPLGVVNIAGSPFMTLLGRPIIVTEKLPALASGSGDDIMFVDWSYYLIGDRQAVSIDYSEHSRFMNDETEMRIIERVDGRPWIQNALTPANGSTLSPIIGLGD